MLRPALLAYQLQVDRQTIDHHLNGLFLDLLHFLVSFKHRFCARSSWVSKGTFSIFVIDDSFTNNPCI